MPALADALALAGLGLRVIPLHGFLPSGRCSCGDRKCPRKRWGKHPRDPGWPDRATTDTAVITGWWRAWPDANIGVATGRGLVVLGVDPDTGGEDSQADLQGRHGRLPDTATARSGSGGRHYYFRVPDALRVRNSVGTLAPGLDVRGDGGQVVAPPSRHYSGGRYEWVRHPAEGIADCPGWLLDLIRDRQRAVPARRRPDRPPNVGVPAQFLRPAGSAGEVSGNEYQRLLRECAERWPITGPGTRYGRTVPLVGSLVKRGVGRDTVLRLVRDWLACFPGQFEHDAEAALGQAEACLRRTLANPDFLPGPVNGDYHLRELSPLQKEFLAAIVQGDTLLLPSGRSLPLSPTLPHVESGREGVGTGMGAANGIRDPRRPRRQRLFGGRQEVAFADAWLAHTLHKVLDTRDTTVRATDAQVMELMQSRSGLEIDRKDYYAIKGKFITRLDRPASKCELLAEVAKGRREPGQRAGTPSEYELGVLGWLLELDSGEQAEEGPSFGAGDAEDAPGGSDAAWWLDEPGEPREAAAGPDTPWWSDES